MIHHGSHVEKVMRGWRWAILFGTGLLVILVPLPAIAAVPTQRTFRLDARRFEYSPAILKVNQGDRVTIELVATDVVHGLAIDGYNLEMMADPGRTSELTFIADRQGVFRIRCTITYSSMHPPQHSMMAMPGVRSNH